MQLHRCISLASSLTIRSTRNGTKERREKKEKVRACEKIFLYYNWTNIDAKYAIWCKGQVQERGNRETEFHDSESTMHQRANH